MTDTKLAAIRARDQAIPQLLEVHDLGHAEHTICRMMDGGECWPLLTVTMEDDRDGAKANALAAAHNDRRALLAEINRLKSWPTRAELAEIDDVP